MSMIYDILGYVLIALIPSMLVLGLLLRRNPFDQKPILFRGSDDLMTVDSSQRHSEIGLATTLFQSNEVVSVFGAHADDDR